MPRIERVIKTAFATSDGRVFDTVGEAREWEFGLTLTALGYKLPVNLLAPWLYANLDALAAAKAELEATPFLGGVEHQTFELRAPEEAVPEPLVPRREPEDPLAEHARHSNRYSFAKQEDAVEDDKAAPLA